MHMHARTHARTLDFLWHEILDYSRLPPHGKG